MKKNPITIGFDDATFDFNSRSNAVPLIGVICQGVRVIKVLKENIIIDGENATSTLINMVLKVKDLVQYIVTHSITFGGFNLVDIEKIYKKTGIPIIAVTESEVDLPSVKKALEINFPKKFQEKIQKIINAGNLYNAQIETAGGISTVHFHVKGMDKNLVENLLSQISIDSKLPESVRIAHIIGRAFRGD
ncbi:MAG: DUF99 family protein [Candidatus Lokiarchaeota archaeon]